MQCWTLQHFACSWNIFVHILKSLDSISDYLMPMKHFTQLSSKRWFGYEVIKQKYHTSHPTLWCFVPAYLLLHICSKLDDITTRFVKMIRCWVALFWFTATWSAPYSLVFCIGWPDYSYVCGLHSFYIHKWFQDITFDDHVCDWHNMWFIHFEDVHIVCTQIEWFIKNPCNYKDFFLRVVWRWRALRDMCRFGFDEAQGFNVTGEWSNKCTLDKVRTRLSWAKLVQVLSRQSKSSIKVLSVKVTEVNGRCDTGTMICYKQLPKRCPVNPIAFLLTELINTGSSWSQCQRSGRPWGTQQKCRAEGDGWRGSCFLFIMWW